MDSMNLNKIIIYTKIQDLSSVELLDSCMISMDGGKVDYLTYTHDMGQIVEADELLDELFDDCYDEDEVDVEINACYNGLDVCNSISKFIIDNWERETMVLFYGHNSEEVFEKVTEQLLDYDSDIIMTEYHDIFTNKKDIDKDIEQTMESVGIRTNMMNKESQVSCAYFLGMLVDRLYDR